MDKRKTNLTVEDFEDKKYGAGKRYTRFKTSEGWISSFDKEIIEKLKDAEGKCVSVEITTDNDDRDKITKFYGEAEEEATSDHHNPKEDGTYPTGKSESSSRKSVKGSAYEKDPVGLAVEVFCAMVAKEPFKTVSPKDGMKMSIALVEDAQKAFE